MFFHSFRYLQRQKAEIRKRKVLGISGNNNTFKSSGMQVFQVSCSIFSQMFLLDSFPKVKQFVVLNLRPE